MVAVAVVPVGSDHTDGTPPPAAKPLDFVTWVIAHRPHSHRDYLHAEESALLIWGRAGDSEACNVLFERYHRTIFEFLKARVNSEQDAEDLTQDTMVNAYRALRDLGHDEFRRWIFTIALNLYRSWCRRLYARFPAFSLEQAQERHGFELSDETISTNVASQLDADPNVTEALRSLTPYQQRVVIDHFLSGYTFRELAMREAKWEYLPTGKTDDPAIERRAEALKQVGQRGRAAFVKRYEELTGINLALSLSTPESQLDQDPSF
jgi:RNA polymerase sigma-70 factor (ECF subfamily)